MDISARNQFKGQVKSVSLGGIMAEVVSAREQELVAAITRGSAEALSLRQGDDVTMIVKSQDVMIGK